MSSLCWPPAGHERLSVSAPFLSRPVPFTALATDPVGLPESCSPTLSSSATWTAFTAPASWRGTDGDSGAMLTGHSGAALSAKVLPQLPGTILREEPSVCLDGLLCSLYSLLTTTPLPHCQGRKRSLCSWTDGPLTKWKLHMCSQNPDYCPVDI